MAVVVRPYMHFVGLCDEFVAEHRVSDVDEGFRALPGGFAFELDDPILGGNILDD